MGDHTIETLAARIAEIEAAGAGRGQRPRSRSAAAQQNVRAPVGEETAGAVGGVPPADDERMLPSRDVNDERHRPAVVDLAGQLAHDEALGVAPDGRPLHEEDSGEGPRRVRKAKQAQLAFSEPEPHARALELAFKLVCQREHTAKQLREKLAKRGCEPAEIAGALAELQRGGFQDDRRYAKIFAEDKRRLQSWGARRIRLELGQAGIARELLDELFADDEAELDAPSELEVALELLRRKQPDLSDPKVKQRMAGMLARRGIASSTVFAALREHERRQAV